MTCFHPLTAYQTQPKMAVSFSMQHKDAKQLQLPCGQCEGCRLERSRQWAIRCIHEASLYDENCWVTLTYRDEDLPWDNSLNKKHFQDFMRKLRYENKDKKIRYFHCGEYGDKKGRPHYHALIFNHYFDDGELCNERDGLRSYSSETLERLWGKGKCEFSELTYENAGYTARYTMKKITGKAVKKINPDTGLKPYERMHLQTSEIITIQPEYCTMSLKPGIGKGWYDKFKDDHQRLDYITHRGVKFRVPKYYDTLYAQTDPEELLAIKEKRKESAKTHEKDQTPARLATRERCLHAKTQRLIRPYE